MATALSVASLALSSAATAGNLLQINPGPPLLLSQYAAPTTTRQQPSIPQSAAVDSSKRSVDRAEARITDLHDKLKITAY